MIRFILADLRRFKSGALAVVVLIALSVALSVTVTLQERAVRLGSARAAEKFDLLVGAAGSETQLALSAVFLQPSPLPLMSGGVLARSSIASSAVATPCTSHPARPRIASRRARWSSLSSTTSTLTGADSAVPFTRRTPDARPRSLR